MDVSRTSPLRTPKRERNKSPYYRCDRFREVGFIWISVSQGPSELSVIEGCPYGEVPLYAEHDFY